MKRELYWKSLPTKEKKLVLMWLYVLRTQRYEEMLHSFATPRWLDATTVNVDMLPEFLFSIKERSIELEMSKLGVELKWI